MADERLLGPIRRFWDREQVEAAYRKIWKAVNEQFDSPVTITGKSSGEDSANGEVTVRPENFREYLEVLETRMQEYDAEAEGGKKPLAGVSHTHFGCRYIGT